MKLDCFETSYVASVNNYLSYAALFSTLRSVLVAIECFGLNCKNATKYFASGGSIYLSTVNHEIIPRPWK